MNAFFVYLRLELKRASKILPYFLTGAVVLTLLLGTIAFLSSQVLYGGNAAGRVTVGVVLPADDLIAKKAVTMLSSMDSVKSICDFEYLDLETARKRLKKNLLTAMMIVPEGFVSDIMNGTNTPISIILPDSGKLESMVFRELTDSGATTLRVAQAGIYAVDEFCYQNQLSELIPEMEAKLNKMYLSYALPREDYFQSKQVSATGDVSVPVYYGISAVTLLLFLCGIPASAILRQKSLVMQQKLKLIGIGSGGMILARILSVAMLLTILSFFLEGAFLIKMKQKLNVWQAGLILLLCLVVAAMIVFIYEVAKTQIAGVMCLFLSVIGMMFVSGGFIPAVFLPDAIRDLTPYMPTTVVMEGIKMMVSARMVFTSVIALIFLLILSYAAAVGVRKCYE